MKDIWYGDNRDIVKWGGIVHLCSKTGIKFVLQIAYYRSHQWLEMSFDNDHVNIPPKVFRHFRSLEDIKRLGIDAGINIQVINKEFKGKIPDEIEDLVKLPGVGRKTANLVLIVGFEKPAMCVDVHVHRIMNRLGYLKTKDNFETEIELREKLPKEYWLEWNKLFVSFGQNHCRPQSPHCSSCPIIKDCNQIKVGRKR